MERHWTEDLKWDCKGIEVTASELIIETDFSGRECVECPVCHRLIHADRPHISIMKLF